MRASLGVGCVATWLALQPVICAPASAADQTGAAGVEPNAKQVVVQDPQSSPDLPRADAPGWDVQRGLQTVLGIEVHTLTDKNTGRVVDLLADQNGKIQAAVVEFGGFLGLGTRKVAVDWTALRFEKAGKEPVATAEITRDQLRLAPEHKPGEPAVVLKALRRTPSTE